MRLVHPVKDTAAVLAVQEISSPAALSRGTHARWRQGFQKRTCDGRTQRAGQPWGGRRSNERSEWVLRPEDVGSQRAEASSLSSPHLQQATRDGSV